MIDRVPDDATLWFVAAGPLEDLVKRYGPRFLDRLAERAVANPRFKMALQGVWGWDLFPAEVRDRLFPILTPGD